MLGKGENQTDKRTNSGKKKKNNRGQREGEGERPKITQEKEKP